MLGARDPETVADDDITAKLPPAHIHSETWTSRNAIDYSEKERKENGHVPERCREASCLEIVLSGGGAGRRGTTKHTFWLGGSKHLVLDSSFSMCLTLVKSRTKLYMT